MNFRTTIALAVTLGLVLGAYLIWRPTETDKKAAPPAPTGAGSTIARDLISPKLGDVVKVVCKRNDQPDWVFEKEAQPAASGQAAWRMTAPVERKAVSWEVDRIARQITGLQYEISYKAGAAGSVSAEQAGLAPAELSVTLTDKEGASATVEIGELASTSETYARLVGKDEIVLAKSNLRTLVKEKALEYGDTELWNFPADKVTQIEISDRPADGPATEYKFVRDGNKWVIAAPVSAKATAKVDELVRAFSRLRVQKWVEDRPDRLAAMGFEPARWTVRVTTEEQVPVEEPRQDEAPSNDNETSEEAEEEKPKTQTKVTTHELRISERQPIGEETNAYIRPGEEPTVGTVAKATIDKFKPVLAEWRDMHVTASDVKNATRVEITTTDGNAVLYKDEGAWKFEDGSNAEETAVSALLKAVEDLSAVAFVEETSPDLGAMGLATPKVQLRLTVPGYEQPERLAVGDFTDAQSKRLVYVRRNESASIAKVRASDIDALVKGPVAYRDRTILDVSPDRIQAITLRVESPLSPEPLTQTFEREADGWMMTAPVRSPARQDRLDKLSSAVARLRAESVVAETKSSLNFGLEAPKAVVQVQYKAAGGEQESLPPEVVELRASEYNGKFYLQVAGRPIVYQIGADLHDQFFTEFRSGDLFDIEVSKVQSFSVRSADQTHTLERRYGKWIYAAEPDVPLDQKKVESLIVQCTDLEAARYVRYGVKDLEAYGLEAPARTVTLVLDDGARQELRVSQMSGTTGKDSGFYATREGKGTEVFLVSPDTIGRLSINLDELELKQH